jgi:integrase
MNGLGGRRRRLDIRGRRDGRKSVPLEARGIGPHDLRRTCAKLCRAAGGELEQTQILLGHVPFSRLSDIWELNRTW